MVDDIITENLTFKFDHYPIVFNVKLSSPEQSVDYIVKDVRNINAIDIEEFKETYLRPICERVTSDLPTNDFETVCLCFTCNWCAK